MPTSKDQSALVALTEYFLQNRGHMHLTGTGAVDDLEQRLCRHYHLPYAVCVSSASAGLLGIALALDLRNTEFVTTPYTYGGTIASWLVLGNRPIFADIDPLSLTLDPEAAERMITSKTKALLAVDIFGIPADSQRLRKVADAHGIWYIADAAQSLGAFRNGEPASSAADALVVSFTTGKTLFAGEGGAVLTRHKEIYDRLIWFTQHPSRQRRQLGLHLDNELAINARIHPLAAVWANAVFDESLSNVIESREQCFRVIDVLEETGRVTPMRFRQHGIEPAFSHLVPAWKNTPDNKGLEVHLRTRGINMFSGPTPVRLIPRQPSFVALNLQGKRGRWPRAVQQAKTRFCLYKSPQTPTALTIPRGKTC